MNDQFPPPRILPPNAAVGLENERRRSDGGLRGIANVGPAMPGSPERSKDTANHQTHVPGSSKGPLRDGSRSRPNISNCPALARETERPQRLISFTALASCMPGTGAATNPTSASTFN